MRVFDTHAHYDDERFDSDRHELLCGMDASGVELILNPGCDIATSRFAVELAKKYPFVYAAVGVHPHAANEVTPALIDELRELARFEKVRAIGEIGLDYHWEDDPPRPVQKEAFAAQLALAEELKLPVIIHDRDAHADCLDVIKAFPNVKGVLHCYSGSAEDAKTYVKMGWYLSFTGVITYKNARRALEAIEVIPKDRLMIETDSPYLTPVPNRGKRNDSTNVHYVARRMAEVLGIDAEEMARITLENGKRFFNIK